MKRNVFIASIAMMVLVCWSCQRMDEDLQTLKDTQWKLEGYADTQTGELKELEPRNCKECYTLTFDTDTTAYGHAMINLVNLTFLGSVCKIGCGTSALECSDDGVECGFYCDALKSVSSYEFTKNRLYFFYNNDENYLLFKLIKK